MTQLPRRFLIALLLLALFLAFAGRWGWCLAITSFCVFLVWVYWPRHEKAAPLPPPRADPCPACGAALVVEYLNEPMDIDPAPEHEAEGAGWTWLRCPACGAHCVRRLGKQIEVIDADEWRSTTRYGIPFADHRKDVERHPSPPPKPPKHPVREAALDGLLGGALASAVGASAGAVWNLFQGSGLGVPRPTLLVLLLSGAVLAAVLAAVRLKMR